MFVHEMEREKDLQRKRFTERDVLCMSLGVDPSIHNEEHIMLGTP